MDLREEGQLEAVFDADRSSDWGRLDFLLHSIAFAPQGGPRTGASSTARKAGFLQAMDVSCWSFIRMAKLAEPLMTEGGALFTHDLLRLPDGGGALQHDGRRSRPRWSSPPATSPPSSGPKGIRVHAISPGPA